MNNNNCKLEDVTADGVVCGDVEVIDGELFATDWREIRVESYYCDCGNYYSREELIKHLGLKGVK